LLVGRLYDARGPIVLLAVPIAAALSAVAFSTDIALVWAGVAVWGVVNGVLDSTVKAVVTELVPSARRAVAFGWLALVRGAGLLVAGAVLGAADDHGRGWVVGLILAANAVALTGLATLLCRVATCPCANHVVTPCVTPLPRPWQLRRAPDRADRTRRARLSRGRHRHRGPTGAATARTSGRAGLPTTR
jgi:MFS family permease